MLMMAPWFEMNCAYKEFAGWKPQVVSFKKRVALIFFHKHDQKYKYKYTYIYIYTQLYTDMYSKEGIHER